MINYCYIINFKPVHALPYLTYFRYILPVFIILYLCILLEVLVLLIYVFIASVSEGSRHVFRISALSEDKIIPFGTRHI